MIVRRKPASDERSFSDDIETHVYEPATGPWVLREGGHFRPGAVRYSFMLGSGHTNIERPRFSDFAIDIDWTDILAMVEFLAEDAKYPPAVALLSRHLKTAPPLSGAELAKRQAQHRKSRGLPPLQKADT